MNPNQLVSRIQKELKRSPAKAAVLGIMCVVAAYMWVPLIWGFVIPESDSPVAETAASETASLSSTTTPVTSTSVSASPNDPNPFPDKKPRLPSWEIASHWIDQDLRMRPTPPSQQTRDPFAPLSIQPKSIDPNATPAADLIASAQQSLRVTSTLITSRRRSAVINGQRCEQGDALEVLLSTQNQHQAIRFVINRVDSKQIILSHEDKQIVLPLEQGRLAPGDLIQRETQNN